ncbi:unnamed protein product, partial [Heligmosomoides polygyrus]|uniref:FLYWCH-type domain-containing protein n=1 Tax=Heligmosomoides polygyrus TaxID=6339 RepID=A0A183GC87_HELPZ
VHYLTCSRSGEQKERPNKKFRRPTRPSIKCGKNCMAYLKMKQNPTVSELKIEACLHHSGHEIDASKIRLERNEVGPSQDLHGRYGLTGMVIKMEQCQVDKDEHFWHLLLFAFD